MSQRFTLLTGLVLLLLFVSPARVQAQSITISGTVTSSEDGEPLPGASVVLQGTSTGTATNADGEYQLTVPDGDGTLLITFVGFIPQEVAIEGRSTIDVQLAPDTQRLEQVVVVGYGTQREVELTGSVARVSSEELEDVTVNSFEEAMQGRAAGVEIQTGSGKLGQGIQVRVRGASSVSANNQPLYVIDGIPVTTDNLSSNGAPTNPLAQLNVDDIESIQVLKDASSAAIYGARASNGVVLITTKSGYAGRTQFNVDISRNVAGPTNKVDLLNADEYVELLMEAAENSARLDPSYDYMGDVEFFFDYLAQGTDWESREIDTNWQDEAFQTGGGFDANVSAQGGAENTQFYLSGEYSTQDGIMLRDEYDRVSGRIKLDHQLSEAVRFGGTLSLARIVHNRLSNDNAFSTPLQLIAQAPISPYYADADPQQSGYQPSDELNPNTLYFNGLLYQDNVRYNTKTFRSLSSAYMEIEPLQDLTWRTQFGFDLLDQNEDEYYNSQVARNTGAQEGLGLNTWNRVINYTVDSYLTYQVPLPESQSLETTLGTSYQTATTDFVQVQGERFPNDDFTQIASAGEITGGSSTETGYDFLSYFGRANYSLMDRYLFKVSGRFDGSSRFGANNRFGFFPAASMGWILSEEAFLQDVDAVSFLKARVSYGLTGNAGIANFAPLGLWGASAYAGTSGILPNQTPNPDLKWERSAQLDVGLDFGLFNDRVSGEIDYYIKNTDDLLLSVNVPATTGYTTQFRNVGKLENRGFEFLLNTVNVDGAFTWRSNFNLSINRNEITDLNGQVIEGGFINRAVEGEPIGVFFGYEYAGVDPENGDALYYVNEMDEDGNILDPEATTSNPNDANRVVLGSPHPDFTGGLRNQFSYKGLELDVFFQFVQGNEIFDGGGEYKTSNGDFLDNQLANQLDRWQQPGDQTDIPEARLYFGNGTADSDRYLYDGSYLRLKTVTLAYSLPSQFLDRFDLGRARVYLTGRNLLTFTDYPWWDPEVNADFVSGNIGLGNEFYTAPQARSLTGGLQFTF